MAAAAVSTPRAASPGPLSMSPLCTGADQLKAKASKAPTTVVRLVYLPLNQTQSPRIFSFPLAFARDPSDSESSSGNSISIGSHSDAHVRVTTASVCPHQCRISLSVLAGTQVIDIKNTGQAVFLVNNSTVSPDSPPLQLCSGDLLVLGANQDRKFRIEIVHPSSVTVTPTASPSSSRKSPHPTTPSHSQALPPGIAATPASIRPANTLPRTPSTAPTRSSLLTATHPRQVHARPPISLSQPRPAPPYSSVKSVKWGPPLRPQLFLASDPPSSPISRGASPPVNVEDASSPSSHSVASASSPLTGMTPRSILKRRAAATTAANRGFVHRKSGGPKYFGAMPGSGTSLLSPKSNSPLRGSSFKFSAPLTVPSASASASGSPSLAAAAVAFASRPKRPGTQPSPSTFASDADESELSDLPSSPSPAAPLKPTTQAKPEAAAAQTPPKSSNRSSLSSHLPIVTSPLTATQAGAATTRASAREMARGAAAVPAPSPHQDADRSLCLASLAPPRERSVELVMVSDSESEMSMVSTRGGDAQAHADTPPRAVLATTSPLRPPEPCARNENTSPADPAPPRSGDSVAPAKDPSPPSMTACKPISTLRAASPALLPKNNKKRARSTVDDDVDDLSEDDDDWDGQATNGTPSKRAKVSDGRRGGKRGSKRGGTVAHEGLRRSMRVRTPVKRLGTF